MCSQKKKLQPNKIFHIISFRSFSPSPKGDGDNKPIKDAQDTEQHPIKKFFQQASADWKLTQTLVLDFYVKKYIYKIFRSYVNEHSDPSRNR